MKFFTAAILLLLTFHAHSKLPTVSYSFSYNTSAKEISVKMKFKGNTNGSTTINLPNKWAGQEHFYRAITQLSVSGKKAVFEQISDSSKRVITHKPGANLEINYTLKQDWDGEILYPNNFRGVLQKEYFQFTGQSLIVLPELGYDNLNISLDWSALPQNWAITNSFHASGKTYKGEVAVSDLLNSLFTAGDFRTYETSVGGKPVHIAIRGDQWKFTDSSLVDRVKVIIGMERRFWNDFSEDYYCVTLIPFDDFGGANGTSLHRAFMLAMGYDQPLQDWLLTHEYFHRWNGTTMRLFEEVEQEHSWFTEGFTEYYSYKLLYQNGLFSKEEYVKSVNDMIAGYYLSPVRNEDRITQGKNYWGTREFQDIPYKKGFVYALWLDHKIRSNGNKSLDDLMFALNNIQIGKTSISYSAYLETANSLAGDISEFQKRYIDNGETIPVESGSLGNDFALEQKDLGVYEAGFDVDATLETDTITGVIEGSSAWNAGLRNGQTPTSYSIYRGNATFPVEIELTENSEKQIITFLPMSNERISVPQFVLR